MSIRLALAVSAALSFAAAAVACSSSDSPVTSDAGTSPGEDGGTVIGTGDNVSGGSGCLISFDGGPAECSIIRINGQSSFQSQDDCPQGSTFVATCPTAMLLGCCSQAGGSGGGATNEEEVCDYQGFPNIYDGGLETTEEIQNFCAQPGVTGAVGRFSATP